MMWGPDRACLYVYESQYRVRGEIYHTDFCTTLTNEQLQRRLIHDLPIHQHFLYLECNQDSRLFLVTNFGVNKLLLRKTTPSCAGEIFP